MARKNAVGPSLILRQIIGNTRQELNISDGKKIIEGGKVVSLNRMEDRSSLDFVRCKPRSQSHLSAIVRCNYISDGNPDLDFHQLFKIFSVNTSSPSWSVFFRKAKGGDHCICSGKKLAGFMAGSISKYRIRQKPDRNRTGTQGIWQLSFKAIHVKRWPFAGSCEWNGKRYGRDDLAGYQRWS